MKFNTFMYVVYVFCVFFVVQANAEDTKEKGYNIVKERDIRKSGFIDFKVDFEMHIKEKGNNTLIRKMHKRQLEGKDISKSMLVFDNPMPIKGISLLTWVYKNSVQKNSQWIYFPKTKRVKRISSSGKTGRFMGSAFTFEDLERHEMVKFNYDYKRSDFYDGKDCFVVRFYPKYEKSRYSFKDVWYDKKEYRPLKANYYDKKENLTKTLTLDEYKIYLKKFWYAHKLVMTNHRKKLQTILIFKDHHFKTGISENYFNKSTLKSAY